MISSVIRQKGESQNGGNKKAKHTKFSTKRTFPPAYQGVRNFGVLCFLVTSVLRFVHLPYYPWYVTFCIANCMYFLRRSETIFIMTTRYLVGALKRYWLDILLSSGFCRLSIILNQHNATRFESISRHHRNSL